MRGWVGQKGIVQSEKHTSKCAPISVGQGNTPFPVIYPPRPYPSCTLLAQSLLSQQTSRASDLRLLPFSALEKSPRHGKYKCLCYLLGMSEGKTKQNSKCYYLHKLPWPGIQYGFLMLKARADIPGLNPVC